MLSNDKTVYIFNKDASDLIESYVYKHNKRIMFKSDIYSIQGIDLCEITDTVELDKNRVLSLVTKLRGMTSPGNIEEDIEKILWFNIVDPLKDIFKYVVEGGVKSKCISFFTETWGNYCEKVKRHRLSNSLQKIEIQRMQRSLQSIQMFLPLIETIGKDTMYYWVPNSMVCCRDCMYLADQGPYLQEEFPTVPKSEKLYCSSKCKCSIVAVVNSGRDREPIRNKRGSILYKLGGGYESNVFDITEFWR